MGNSRKKKSILILPFPKGEFINNFNRLFPFEVFPGGMHELILILLGVDTVDMFAQEALQVIEDTVSEYSDFQGDKFIEKYQSQENMKAWEVLLCAFYEYFDPVLRELLGGVYPTNYTSNGYNTKCGVSILIE